jgi:hypothetical protein
MAGSGIRLLNTIIASCSAFYKPLGRELSLPETRTIQENASGPGEQATGFMLTIDAPPFMSFVHVLH